MTTDWVYPVDKRSDSWGYSRADGSLLPVLELMSSRRLLAGRHDWHLPRRLKGFCAGDRIWVRASLPIGKFVGMGRVMDEPEWKRGAYYFDVRWDTSLCRQMAQHPFAVLEKRAESIRFFTQDEHRQLHARVASLQRGAGRNGAP